MATIESVRPVASAREPRRRFSVRPFILYPVTTILALAFFFPFFYAIGDSLKTAKVMYQYPPILFPANPQFINYVTAFTTFPFVTWYRNTFEVVILYTAGIVIMSTIVAYGFARFDFRFRNVLFIITIATLMIPSQVMLIPRYIEFHLIGWLNTLLPLWVPAWFGGSPFAIFLMRQFLMTLPRELDEAAIIDGASYPRILWQILAPLCKPAIATLAILSVIASWDNFLEPIIYLQTQDKFTVSIGIWYFKDQEFQVTPTDQLLMAAAVTSVIPLIVLFFSFQRYFVEGIVLTGIKG